MTGYDEPLMQLEASRYSARFIKKPIKSPELLEAVRRSLAAVRRERRWPRKRVLGGFRVTAAGRPAAVVDVSYGGLCLRDSRSRRRAGALRRRSVRASTCT